MAPLRRTFLAPLSLLLCAAAAGAVENFQAAQPADGGARALIEQLAPPARPRPTPRAPAAPTPEPPTIASLLPWALTGAATIALIAALAWALTERRMRRETQDELGRMKSYLATVKRAPRVPEGESASKSPGPGDAVVPPAAGR
ncbi:MAG: hypothetical protein EXR72_05005 [Myxococcales bacterium]|nr:hypothetical protein [Myxococcales bacterium]